MFGGAFETRDDLKWTTLNNNNKRGEVENSYDQLKMTDDLLCKMTDLYFVDD